METHDEMDKAGPQKEISSDFKSGPVTRGIGAQRSSGVSAQIRADPLKGLPVSESRSPRPRPRS